MHEPSMNCWAVPRLREGWMEVWKRDRALLGRQEPCLETTTTPRLFSAFQNVVTWIHSSCVHHECTVPHMRTRAASLLASSREGGGVR
jgi:hypothetical protein